MSADASALARQTDAVVASLGTSLQRGVDELNKATASVLASDDREAAASAVPYLWLAGTVTGGWLMCRAADAATVQLGAGSDDRGFLQSKRITALHFARHMLQQAPAMCEAVAHGAESTLGLHQDQF